MIVVGIEWTRADAATIARVRSHGTRFVERLRAAPSVHGVVLLATCARVECYIDATRFHEATRTFVDELAQCLDVDPLVAEAFVDMSRGERALNHLFEVASGLRSAVIGEDQIVGQVSDALAVARAEGTASRSLGIAFEQAIALSRQTRPLLGAGGRSVVDAALGRLGSVRQALVLGSGALAEVAIRELRAHGALFIAQHSASGRTSRDVDAQIGEADLVEALSLVDVVVACSGTHGVLISQAQVHRAWETRRTRLTIVDLSGGIDVDARIADNPEVEVIGLDDVSDAASAVGVNRARALVAEAVDVIGMRIVDSDLDALIASMRSRVEDAAWASLEGTRDPAAHEAVRRAVQALLHGPTVRIREAARAGRLDEARHAIALLFESHGDLMAVTR